MALGDDLNALSQRLGARGTAFGGQGPFENRFFTPPIPQRSALEGFNAFAPHSVLASALDSYPPVLPKPTRRRVFASFKYADLWAVEHYRQLATGFDFEVYDESVKVAFDSRDASYIRRRLRQRIGRTSVTVCFVGERTYKSRWVDFELRESLDKGNTIIATGLPNGPSELRFPKLIASLDIPVMQWDPNWLRGAIASARKPIPIPDGY